MSNATSTKTSPSVLGNVRPVLVLVAICAVAGLLLGFVYNATEPVAAANAEERAQLMYEQLVPQASAFTEVPCTVEGCVAALEAIDESGARAAVVIVAESKGYGGPVPIAVAFAEDGTVLSVMAMANDETPGLGTHIADDDYIGQYVGLEAKPLDAEFIDLISGATISSKAALSAFNIAVEAYLEVR